MDAPDPAADWVVRGEDVATRKLDGASCPVRGGVLFRRRELKAGQPAPDGFISKGADPEASRTVGWVPAEPGPDDGAYREASEQLAASGAVTEGTYELLVPKVQGNPEDYPHHTLLPHALAATFPDDPRSHAGLAAWLAGQDIEDLVFRRPDGRMAKIKLGNFGFKRRVSSA